MLKLDIILPYSLDLTPEGKVIEINPEQLSNIQFWLNISFTEFGELDIDYKGEDDNWLLANLVDEEFCTTCDISSLVAKQYEIASKLGINTTDI